MERTIKISIKELLKFLKAIDGVPDEMYSVLREKGLLKMPINKVKGANEVDTSGFTTIFLEAMNCAYMDFQYKIAHELGMPEYDIDNSSVYDYVEMMFITYYNDEITEDELIEGIEINAKDPNFKQNPKFIKAIGGWEYLNLS